MTWASLLTFENFENVLDLLELKGKLAGQTQEEIWTVGGGRHTFLRPRIHHWALDDIIYKQMTIELTLLIPKQDFHLNFKILLCHLYLHIFLLEIKIKIGKIYTAFQFFLQAFSPTFLILYGLQLKA